MKKEEIIKDEETIDVGDESTVVDRHFSDKVISADILLIRHQLSRLQEQIMQFRSVTMQLQDKVKEHAGMLVSHKAQIKSKVDRAESEWEEINKTVREILKHVKKENGIVDSKWWATLVKILIAVIIGLVTIISTLLGIEFSGKFLL